MSVKVMGTPDRLALELPAQGETWVRDGDTMKGAAAGGGGASLIHGVFTFDTDGSGDPQTYSGNAIGFERHATDTEPPAHRGGVVLPAGTLANLRVKPTNMASGSLSAVSWSVAVYRNGTLTILNCTGGGSDAGVVNNDPGDALAIAEFDVVQFFVSSTQTDEGSNPQTQCRFHVSAEFTPS